MDEAVVQVTVRGAEDGALLGGVGGSELDESSEKGSRGGAEGVGEGARGGYLVGLGC